MSDNKNDIMSEELTQNIQENMMENAPELEEAVIDTPSEVASEYDELEVVAAEYEGVDSVVTDENAVIEQVEAAGAYESADNDVSVDIVQEVAAEETSALEQASDETAATQEDGYEAAQQLYAENVTEESSDVGNKKKGKGFGKKTGAKKSSAKKAKNSDKKNSFITLIKNKLSIKVKLIGAFIVPIIFIVILGIVSYTQSADAIQKSFTESSVMTINKTAEFYDLMFDNVKAAANDLANNKNFQSYYGGALSTTPYEETQTYNTLAKDLSSTALSNEALACVTIVGSYGKPMYTVANTADDTELFTNIKNSKEGKLIEEKKNLWISSREYVSTIAANWDSAVSYSRQIISSGGRFLGYMFFEKLKGIIQENTSFQTGIIMEFEYNFDATDVYANVTFESFDLTLPFKNYQILDSRTEKYANKMIEEADLIFLLFVTCSEKWKRREDFPTLCCSRLI